MKNNKANTNEIFIQKARSVHGDLYSYDLVDYKNNNTKVDIICKTHGVFSQAPRSHLSGSGCPKCKGVSQLNTDEFIRKAILVHGDLYDYSKTCYKNAKTHVDVICKKHGMFKITPDNHLRGRGCKLCYDEKRKVIWENKSEDELKKHGDTISKAYNMKSEEEKNVARLNRGIGRIKWWKSLSEEEKLLQGERVKKGHKENNRSEKLEKYWTKERRDNRSEKLRQMWAGFDEQDRQNRANAILNGYSNMSPSKRLQHSLNIKKAWSNMCLSRRQMHSLKISDTWSKFSEERKKEIAQKRHQTCKDNGTYGKSKREDLMYYHLVYIFGKDEVKRQYTDDRYSFACDFYISSFDLFIEGNFHWTHGGHFFDENNEDDIKMRDTWLEKSKTSKFYEQALFTWTKRDIEKRDIAQRNDLNYLVFWKNDLSDFYEWVEREDLLWIEKL